MAAHGLACRRWIACEPGVDLGFKTATVSYVDVKPRRRLNQRG